MENIYNKYLHIEKGKAKNLHYVNGRCYVILEGMYVYKEIAMPRGNVFQRIDASDIPEDLKRYLVTEG